MVSVRRLRHHIDARRVTSLSVEARRIAARAAFLRWRPPPWSASCSAQVEAEQRIAIFGEKDFQQLLPQVAVAPDGGGSSTYRRPGDRLAHGARASTAPSRRPPAMSIAPEERHVAMPELYRRHEGKRAAACGRQRCRRRYGQRHRNGHPAAGLRARPISRVRHARNVCKGSLPPGTKGRCGCLVAARLWLEHQLLIDKYPSPGA